MKKIYSVLLIFFYFASNITISAQILRLGADRMEILLPEINSKRIALVVNQTSLLSNNTHLLDTLVSEKVNVVKIFAPEHGFRGNADAGEKIIDGKDSKTGIPVVSLYGRNYKPSVTQLEDIDIVIFDIQDVGIRYYTYISTMHYIMEACAENRKQCIVLDRPNPNDYIDGPVLNLKYKSFIGMHPIPAAHGLTVGELAQMINGEGWLKNNVKCDLNVIPMTGWQHGQKYILPVKPSPNLPNNQSIKLFPSICFFEGTNVSVGRGTDFPFQVIGATSPKYGKFTFTPRSTEGAKNPPNINKKCYGEDLRDYKTNNTIELNFLIRFYKKSGLGASFFSNPKHFDLLAGSDTLRTQIMNGYTEDKIRESWQKDLNLYRTIRKKYLLYRDNN